MEQHAARISHTATRPPAVSRPAAPERDQPYRGVDLRPGRTKAGWHARTPLRGLPLRRVRAVDQVLAAQAVRMYAPAQAAPEAVGVDAGAPGGTVSCPPHFGQRPAPDRRHPASWPRHRRHNRYVSVSTGTLAS